MFFFSIKFHEFIGNILENGHNFFIMFDSVPYQGYQGITLNPSLVEKPLIGFSHQQRPALSGRCGYFGQDLAACACEEDAARVIWFVAFEEIKRCRYVIPRRFPP